MWTTERHDDVPGRGGLARVVAVVGANAGPGARAGGLVTGTAPTGALEGEDDVLDATPAMPAAPVTGGGPALRLAGCELDCPVHNVKVRTTTATARVAAAMIHRRQERRRVGRCTLLPTPR
jgi:hypothetical protein